MLCDWHKGDSAKSSYIPRHEKVHTQCCNTEVSDNPLSPFSDVHVLFDFMGAKNLAADAGPTQPLPDDCVRSFAAQQHKELLVGLVAREVLPTAISKHHFASVQAVPAQASNRLLTMSKANLRSNTAKPFLSAVGSICALEQAGRGDISREKKSRQDLQQVSGTHVDSE